MQHGKRALHSTLFLLSAKPHPSLRDRGAHQQRPHGRTRPGRAQWNQQPGESRSQSQQQASRQGHAPGLGQPSEVSPGRLLLGPRLPDRSGLGCLPCTQGLWACESRLLAPLTERVRCAAGSTGRPRHTARLTGQTRLVRLPLCSVSHRLQDAADCRGCAAGSLPSGLPTAQGNTLLFGSFPVEEQTRERQARDGRLANGVPSFQNGHQNGMQRPQMQYPGMAYPGQIQFGNRPGSGQVRCALLHSVALENPRQLTPSACAAGLHATAHGGVPAHDAPALPAVSADAVHGGHGWPAPAVRLRARAAATAAPRAASPAAAARPTGKHPSWPLLLLAPSAAAAMR